MWQPPIVMEKQVYPEWLLTVVEGCLLKAQTQAYRSQKHNCLGFLHIATVIVFIEVIENGSCLPSK